MVNSLTGDIGKFDIYNKTNIHMEDLATLSDEMMVREVKILK